MNYQESISRMLRRVISAEFVVVLFSLAMLFPIGFAAQSQKQRDAAAQQDAAAQHARDLATIDRLTRENEAMARATAGNGAAIVKLGTDNKARAAAETLQGNAHAAAVQQTLETVQTLRPKIDDVAAKVDTVAAKVDEIQPYDYRPILLSAIPAAGAMFAGIVSIVLAVVTRGKVVTQGATIDKVHALTNSAMSASKESTATARRANAVSLQLIYRLEPTEGNRAKAEDGERLASEAEKDFEEHMRTQDALNRNDAKAQADAAD